MKDVRSSYKLKNEYVGFSKLIVDSIKYGPTFQHIGRHVCIEANRTIDCLIKKILVF